MNDINPFMIASGCMGVMAISFGVVFVIIVRYLISAVKLLHQVKTNEPELWESLGRPTMFPGFQLTLNPFKDLIGQMDFCSWFLAGGDGSMMPETKAMVERTQRLFRNAGIGFVVVFLIFGICIGGMFMLFGTQGSKPSP